MNIAAQILRHGWTDPLAEAVIDGERIVSYGELRDETLRTAQRLREKGVTRGKRVGLCLRDTLDHIVALLAITRLGAVAVPLDWRARPGETSRLAEASEAQLVLVEPEAAPIAKAETLAWGDEWRGLVANAATAEIEATGGNDPFVIAASSGSTGAAKLTVMSHLQYHFAVAGMLEVLDLSGRHRYLNTLPLYYSGGRNSCLAHLLRGDCVILHPSLFEVDEYVDFARRNRASVAVMTPTMIRRFLRDRGGDGAALAPDLKTIFSTGAPLFAQEKLDARRLINPRFQERFGTAETLVLTALRSDRLVERPESVGQPHSLVDIEIVDDFHQTLPAGEVGQLRCRGPGVASPLAGGGGQSSFRQDWFYPGEVGWLDDRGFLFLQGRVSEVIIRGGAKIHPAEIEQVLREHARVTEAAVVGRVDADGEGQVVAFVSTQGDVPTGELIAFCRNRLAPHKAPKRIYGLAELPKNATGKIDKLALRDLAVEFERASTLKPTGP